GSGVLFRFAAVILAWMSGSVAVADEAQRQTVPAAARLAGPTGPATPGAGATTRGEVGRDGKTVGGAPQPPPPGRGSAGPQVNQGSGGSSPGSQGSGSATGQDSKSDGDTQFRGRPCIGVRDRPCL